MVELDRYFPRIRPHVKGCPDAVIKEALIITLRDICQRTKIWRHATQLYAVKGLKECALSTPNNTEVATVEAIAIKGRKLEKKTTLPMDASTGVPYCFSHYELGKIELYPTPSANQICDAKLTLMPDFAATEIPDAVFSDTAEFAPWGVLSQLQLIEKEDWVNPQQAEYNRQRYERSLQDLRLRGFVGVSGSSQAAIRRGFV